MPYASWVRRIVLALSLLAAGSRTIRAAEPAPGPYWVLIGTYTGGKSEGIYRCTLDTKTGKLSNVTPAAKAVNPSFLAFHPSQGFLYCVDEIADFGGKKAGGASAFAFEAKTGTLTRLNEQSTVGAGPCHLVVDREGKNLLVANYGGGSACVLPIGSDGRLKPASDFVQHQGSGADPGRQEGPHAHSVNLDNAGRFAAVADLGLDQVRIYRFDAARGKLTPNEPPYAKLHPGAGPRHFAFHPKAPFAYVINELDSTVTAFAYDAEKGTLTALQTLRTVPEGVTKNYPADVQVHPSGRFLYGSNRGHDSIAVFTIDPQTGKLMPKGQQGEGIKTPRGFGIDPTGSFLLVGNQDGDSLVCFRIDPETGALEPTGQKVEVPKPVCVKFAAVAP